MRVKYFVRLIKTGTFMCTHQGIALDNDGNILDGRHRLTAISESGCSTFMMVSKGVPIETMAVIDCNQPRTLLNRLSISGVQGVTPSHIAVLRILEYGITGASQAALGIEDAECLLEKYRESLDFILVDGKAGSKVPAPISAVLARAYYDKRNRPRLLRFIEVYKNETPKNDGETGALRLKRFVLNCKNLKLDRTINPIETRNRIYWTAESAISRFLKSENVAALIPAKEERFKLPGEE